MRISLNLTLRGTASVPQCCLFTFDFSDGVLSVLQLLVRGLSLGAVLYRVLVHAGVSRQQTHEILLTVVADGAAVTQRFLGRRGGGETM